MAVATQRGSVSLKGFIDARIEAVRERNKASSAGAGSRMSLDEALREEVRQRKMANVDDPRGGHTCESVLAHEMPRFTLDSDSCLEFIINDDCRIIRKDITDARKSGAISDADSLKMRAQLDGMVLEGAWPKKELLAAIWPIGRK